MFQVQTGEVNGLGLRPITDRDHSQSTNGHLPQVGHTRLKEAAVKPTHFYL